VLLHVTTTKGKGYSPAEENPVYFHGCSRFDVSTGNCLDSINSVPSYTQVFGRTMVELAASDERIVAVTAAMPEGTGLAEFGRIYPERFYDVGIAEQHGVTFAAGLALEGLRPVVAIYSTFLQRAYDQIVHDVCLEGLPVIFAIDRGGIVGEDGPTHHGLFDLSFLRSLPNMTVMAPKDENELRRMLVTAIQHDGPIALRYPRGAGVGVSLTEAVQPLSIGQAEQLTSGGDALILAIGRPVMDAMRAREQLAADGIAATVVNCRFVKPLDSDLISSLADRIPHILTVEENVLQGGFGSAITELISDSGIQPYRLKRIGIPDEFVPHGTPDQLRSKYGISAAGIESAVRLLLS
jgi:1-deoxy-D-xylulose-5-phosphate synthase